ncbi:uncharacterized mitochondrial protein AtMg00810-like [Gossypium raimondii]|uniref:uncharacterized mitochondrial protein AtMg00810-like n=1 Tax=Gossypium raimondii TaxID=29730 RepID=UPI00227A4D59|nr:uncharacterized mitochondrial protein AtMg00810-like [Gossypium raimondii]
MVKHVTVRTVISVATMNDWPLFQMDVYNAFLQGSDIGMINELKTVLHQNFKMNDLGALKFFLGIEVMRSSKGIVLSQRKYVLKLIVNVWLGEAKPTSTPLEQNQKLTSIEYDETIQPTVNGDELVLDIAVYQQLLRRLLYLTNIRPDISFAVQHLS